MFKLALNWKPLTQAVAALVAVAQREPTFFTQHSETAFRDKDTTSYPGSDGDGFRYPTVLERYKVPSIHRITDRFSPQNPQIKKQIKSNLPHKVLYNMVTHVDSEKLLEHVAVVVILLRCLTEVGYLDGGRREKMEMDL